ncbi:MAG: hypothetical protein J5556_04835, partial [Deltaproteobacteria bacterium]|nr:hypothetical protein [Deltaproteobacteria bacterium]
MSFEFLASAEDWENECLRNPRDIDRIPEGFQSKGEQVWTFPAQLLATLNATPLKNTAQNGDRNRTIGGYPR